MATMFEHVREFHETYGLVVNDTPQVPDQDTVELRFKLHREEYKELQQAVAEGDLVEIADACCDLIYVICGTAVSYGIPLDTVFAEVQASNMSKLGEDGNPIVRDDGKILKGPNFFKPRIRNLLLEAGWSV